MKDKRNSMTYIISTITDKSILMASDSRLNYHHQKINNATGETYQIITHTADCIRKTFIVNPFNIGVQFIGIGYFNDSGEEYPLSQFITRLANGINSSDIITKKFRQIYLNIKKLTRLRDAGQYINGVMTGYENSIPYISTFNTFIDDFTVNAYETGTYVESKKCQENRPKDRDEAIKYLVAKISRVSQESPQDIGGPIEILEILPDGTNSWVQENLNLFNGTRTELLYKFQNEIQSISGKMLNPPVIQRLEI
ncbi:hypothetical protein [Salmonirosea aquatica]|uniref:Uncharacterized protein n=1 Tax=Salmonirosea aquatica TaxID=2654236 RepID=A0A7C9FPQ1_9BACT|nr:hypothetical protein [Cytophagaceae bacterium SJW1-29]